MNKCICVFLPRRVKKDKNKIEGTPILKLAMVKKKLYTVGIHTVGIHTVGIHTVLVYIQKETKRNRNIQKEPILKSLDARGITG